MKKQTSAFKIIMMSGLAVLFLSSCGTAASGGTVLKVTGTAPGTPLTSIAGSRSLFSRAVSGIDIPVEYPAGTPVGTITLTTARILVKEFQIEQEGAGDTDTEYEFNGPYVVDLIANTMDPQPDPVDLPPGTYTEIEFKIDKAEGDETDDSDTILVENTDPLFGHSILLEGTYTPEGGGAVPFDYTFDIDAEFQLKAPGDTAVGFEITGDPADLIVAFRLKKWFIGIDPAAFVADPAAFAEELKENIKLSADYGKDSDGDGKLSSAEDDDPDSEDDEDS